MVVIQNAPCVGNIEVVFGEILPRQLQHEIEIGADDVKIRRRGRQLLQPLQFAFRLPAHFVRQIGLGQLLLQRFNLGLISTLIAQLGLNGAQLLAQQVFALLSISVRASVAILLRSSSTCTS